MKVPPVYHIVGLPAVSFVKEYVLDNSQSVRASDEVSGQNLFMYCIWNVEFS